MITDKQIIALKLENRLAYFLASYMYQFGTYIAMAFNIVQNSIATYLKLFHQKLLSYNLEHDVLVLKRLLCSCTKLE